MSGGGEQQRWSGVTVQGRYRVQPRLLSEKGKTILLFVKCQGCGSNSEELIRPKCFGPTLRYRELVEEESCEKSIIEGSMSLIPRRICTHARTRWCARLQNHTHTHTHANRHVRIKLKEQNSQTNWNENFSTTKIQKFATWKQFSRRAIPEFSQDPSARGNRNY